MYETLLTYRCIISYYDIHSECDCELVFTVCRIGVIGLKNLLMKWTVCLLYNRYQGDG